MQIIFKRVALDTLGFLKHLLHNTIVKSCFMFQVSTQDDFIYVFIIRFQILQKYIHSALFMSIKHEHDISH